MSAGQLLKQANQLKRAGRLDEAIALYHQVIEINPNFAWGYYNLGDAFFRQGKLNEAINAFSEAVKLNPKSPFFQYALAEAMGQNNQLDKAISNLFKALGKNLRLINQLKSSKSREKFSYVNICLREDKYFVHFCKNHQAKNSILITARYRTGSTYLYTLLSSLVDVAAFYEPLNEEVINWLGKDEQSTEENQAVFAHTLRDNYFGEYKSLNREKLKQSHSREFGTNKMVMSRNDYYYKLKNYISFLLSSFPNKLNVLQFNRIDFRLAWFKVNFPQALIVNLRRNPRDTYVSYIETHLRADRKTSFDPNHDLGGMFCLDFYIKLLGSTSIPQFCIYELNNYEKIYLVNQLSNLWADKFADVIVSYESLVNNPEDVLSEIVANIPNYEFKLVEKIVEPKKNRINVWSKYHPNSWFEKCEEKCDVLLEQILTYSENYPYTVTS